jgi:uncharacterized protein (DUF58 family)
MNPSVAQARSQWTVRLTDLGRHTLWATFLVLLASLLVPAFGALCTLICLQVIGLAISLALRPKVSLFCDAPDRLVVGQEASVRLEVRNDSTRPAYDLVCGLDSLPQTFGPTDTTRSIESLMPGQSVQWSCKLSPLRRGRHVLGGAVCRSAFPLNLVSVGTSLSTRQTLLVLPAFRDLDGFTLDRRAAHGGHRRLLGRAGVYPEYLGNRPYLPGDAPRRIDARAWARLSVPVVREFQDTGEPGVGLFLDTHLARVPGTAMTDAFEAAVSLCASLAHSASRGCTIEWFAAGCDMHSLAEVPTGRRFDRIHDLLAEVEPAGPDQGGNPGQGLAERSAAVSAVLFVLLSWEGPQRQWVEQARQAGCRAIALVVAGTADTREGPESAEVHWVSPSQAREGDVRL